MSSIFFFEQQFTQLENHSFLAFEVFFYTFSLAFYFFLLRCCIFKTDWIINKLRLDEGFTETLFEFNTHRSTIVKTSVIIIGGLLLLENVPLFFKDLLSYFQHAANYKNFTDSKESTYIVIYIIEIFIGYFMLTCSRMVVNYIELKRKKPVTVDEE